MNALLRIEKALNNLGYGDETIFRDYGFADVLAPAGDARSVKLAAFTQTPESFRSAAFGVVIGDLPEDEIMANRALGAPIFLSIGAQDVGVWRVGSSSRPTLIERVNHDAIEELFSRHADAWSPQALHRAKSLGAHNPNYQVDFVDLGLLPAIESEVQQKLQRVLGEVIILLAPDGASPDVQKFAFRITFRLLAAKILADRKHPDAQQWAVNDVNSVLRGIEAYYRLPVFAQDTTAVDRKLVTKAWAIFQGMVNLRNISSDSLAFVYENTLVTADTRKLFGTHSTPRSVAEFVLNQVDLSQFDVDTMRVVEPFAGAGIFLVAALRQMRDQLPAGWSAEQRHDYLTSRLAGAELDVFACEVATLSLIMADYPNANGWKVKPRDLFVDGALKEVLAGATVILCNPPFEDFSQVERSTYPEAFVRTPTKGIFALDAALDAHPQALGFVLPRGFLLQKQYAAVRARLAELYSHVELVSLPDRIFEKATYPSALIFATHRRDATAGSATVQLTAKEVFDSDREHFLATGTVSLSRTAIRSADTSKLWVSALDNVWDYLGRNPKLGDKAEIFRGLQWRVQSDGVSSQRREGFRQGLFKPSASMVPFRVVSSTWLNFNPEASLYPGPLTRSWAAPKVFINNQRSSRGPWRLYAAYDVTGLAASQQFTAIWPTADLSGIVLEAILNSPLANAYVTEHTTDHDFTNLMLGTLPLPKNLQLPELEQAVEAYKAALEENDQLLREVDDDRLSALLLVIDALVLKAYDLPPRLERQLLDYFRGASRPTSHRFNGWMPEGFKGFMPLHEWLSQAHKANEGPWVAQVFKPVPIAEAEAFARFVD